MRPSDQQPDLFSDREQMDGDQRKEAGIQSVLSSSRADEAQALADAMLYCCSAYQEFTSDHLREYLERNYPGVTVRPAAIGAAFNRAARAGDITFTGQILKAQHSSCHSRMVRVWRPALPDATK